MKTLLNITAISTLAAFALNANATNGYFTHANSVKSQGLSGASTALALDSLSATLNPALLSKLGSDHHQMDIGVTYFKPVRSAKITGSPMLNGSYSANNTKDFWIPELGFAGKATEQLSYGVALYGNGGMNTDYKNNPFTNMGGQGSAGVNLEQMFLTTTLAYEYLENQSIGFGLSYAYQEFEAKGLQPFQGMSSNPSKVTNNGKDHSQGWNVKLGWQGTFDRVSLGAAWTSKSKMGKFKKYQGLFAEKGGFDIPESFTAGLAWNAIDPLTLSFDWEYIKYGKVKSIANTATQGGPLGAKNGAGFGWKNINVYKLGLQYQAAPKLTLRTGYSYNDSPIPSTQTFFNILAPGVIKKHFSLGASVQLNVSNEISFAYTHAFKEKVKGHGSVAPTMGGGEANIQMYQDQFAVAWQYRF